MIKFDKLNLKNVFECDYNPEEGCCVVFKNGLGVICKWINDSFEAAVLMSRKGIKEAVILKKLYGTPTQIVNYMDYLDQLNPLEQFEEMCKEFCTMDGNLGNGTSNS